MPLKIIVAYDQNRAIGYKNNILWRNKTDQKRMRNLVYYFPLIMGNNTFNSIYSVLGRTYNEEINYVLTRDNQTLDKKNIILKNDNVIYLEDINHLVSQFEYKTAWIFGGEAIYKLFLPHVEEIYATEIKKSFNPVDSFFPDIEENNWTTEIEKECEYFRFKIFRRSL